MSELEEDWKLGTTCNGYNVNVKWLQCITLKYMLSLTNVQTCQQGHLEFSLSSVTLVDSFAHTWQVPEFRRNVAGTCNDRVTVMLVCLTYQEYRVYETIAAGNVNVRTRLNDNNYYYHMV